MGITQGLMGSSCERDCLNKKTKVPLQTLVPGLTRNHSWKAEAPTSGSRKTKDAWKGTDRDIRGWRSRYG